MKNNYPPATFRILLLAIIFYCISPFVFSQQRVNGRVNSSEDQLPLFSVSVILKGSHIGTVTDSAGFFHITAEKGRTLVISYIGYATREVVVGDQTVLNISLSKITSNLDQVVMTGYVSQKIKEITGSVAVVKPEDLTAVPAGQVEQMLQGRVAGLTVITSGMPGGGSNVRLHGLGNFGDVTPLYIIDGVPGDINSLNPDDIESLQVLKDAGSYAIYGVRGANGVIVVTTRSGKAGRTRVSYDFYLGTTRPLKHGPDLLSPQEQANLTWIADRNSGQVDPTTGNPNDPFYGSGATPVLPDYLVAGPYTGLFNGDPRVNASLYNIDYTAGPLYQIIAANKNGTDWFHELFKPVITQNHTLSVSGAGEKNKYLFSVGYLDQQGTLLNTYLKRFTARVNTEFAVDKNIRIGENLQLSYRDNPRITNQQPGLGNEIATAIFQLPILPVYDIKGGWASFDPSNLNSNPVASRQIAKDNSSKYWDAIGNAFAELKFLKNFTLRTSFGGTFTDYYFNSYNYAYNETGTGLPNNSLTETSGYTRSWTWTNTLNFSRTFHNIHKLTVLVGTEAISNYNREQDGTGSGFFSNDPNYRFLSNAAGATTVSSFAGVSSLYSLISRADYGFMDKILVSGTLRRDGSSVFGAENRYGWFPSLSAAWRLTQENFMKGVKWLTDLKIRSSWGKTGFYGNTDPYNQYTLYGGSFSDAFYDINGTSTVPVAGLRTIRIGEPRTGWQQDIVTNFGFESILWNGKFSMTADWYRKESSGLLFPLTLPEILGAATPPEVNIGKVQNKGLDILVGSKGNFFKDWKWNVSVTLTTYRSEVLKLNNVPYYDVGYFTRNQVGYPAGSFFGYKAAGFFRDASDVTKSPVQQDAAPGRFKYVDANRDGNITDDDRVHYGNPNPKFTAGVNIGFNYKGFDFSTFCYGSFGNDVINIFRVLTNTYTPLPGSAAGVNSKSKTALYDSWTPQHLDAKAPIAETQANFSNVGAGPTSYGVEKGTYFRNKSMILGYSFPPKSLLKNKIEKLRVYIQAVNLFTLTKYQGLDPELSGSSMEWGVDYGNYPNNQKQYLVGLSLNF